MEKMTWSLINICVLCILLAGNTRTYKLYNSYGSSSSSSSETCDAIIDMVFLLAERESFNDTRHFSDMKNFINSIVSAFDPVGTNGAQFAALYVDETIGDHFYLKEHQSANGVMAAVSAFSDESSNHTAIGLGLRRIKEEYFKQENGGKRPCVVEMIVVLTDGKNNIGELPGPVAEELKAEGVIIFAVGVGNSIDGTELLQISSGSAFVHTVHNALDLDTVVQFIVGDACEKSNCMSEGDYSKDKKEYDSGNKHLPIQIEISVPVKLLQTISTNKDDPSNVQSSSDTRYSPKMSPDHILYPFHEGSNQYRKK